MHLRRSRHRHGAVYGTRGVARASGLAEHLQCYSFKTPSVTLVFPVRQV